MPIELINAFNYDFINRRNPLGYFGMIVVLENASVDQATQTRLDNLQKGLGLGPECFSYLSSHGALDIEHTQFIGNLLNTITDPKDQEDIIHATKVIYHLYAEMCRGLPHKSQEKKAA